MAHASSQVLKALVPPSIGTSKRTTGDQINAYVGSATMKPGAPMGRLTHRNAIHDVNPSSQEDCCSGMMEARDVAVVACDIAS